MWLTRGPLLVLAEPTFRGFFVGRAVSLLGDGMVGVALSFAVLDLTRSPADLGDVLAARSVPRGGAGLFRGGGRPPRAPPPPPPPPPVWSACVCGALGSRPAPRAPPPPNHHPPPPRHGAGGQD